MLKLLRFIVRISVMLGVPIFVGLLVYMFMDSFFFKPVNPDAAEPVLFEIVPGKNFKEYCQDLEEKGLLKSWRSLYYTARVRGSKQQIKAGEYSLSGKMTPREILDELLQGKIHRRKLVVKPGMILQDVALAIEESGLATQNDFLNATSNSNLLAKAGLGAKSFEGFLAPNEYSFTKADSIQRIIWTMLEIGERNWNPEFQKRAEDLGFTREEILVLASVIQKESEKGKVEDQPLISSVFHNRLKNAMKLWSKATVAYGLKKYNETLREEDLKTPSEYNTFLNYGLPEGAICSPGVTAINAALYPEETTYLFFVPDGVGGIVFARTEREYRDALFNMLNGG